MLRSEHIAHLLSWSLAAVVYAATAQPVAAVDPAVRVDSSGNVGVGTTTPGVLSDGTQSSLHVVRSDGDASILLTEQAGEGVYLLYEIQAKGHPFFRISDIGATPQTWQFGIGAFGFVIDDPDQPGDSFEVRENGDVVVSGTVVHSSDVARKQDLSPVDPAAILKAVKKMEINTWAYRRSPGAKHIGPTAQEFHRAFGLGNDDTMIAAVDADGVALAAVQGLANELTEKDLRLAAIERRNERLEEQNAELLRRNAAIARENQNFAQRLERIEALLGVARADD